MQPELDPLAQLRDIHFPADPHWWPPAPGWWILFLAVLLITWLLIKMVIGFRNSRKPRKAALRDLHAVAATDNPAEIPHAIQRMITTVRQFTIHEFGREIVSSLHGDKWIAFLKTATNDRWTPGEKVEQALLKDVYEKTSTMDIESLRNSLLELCRQLNRNHLKNTGQS